MGEMCHSIWINYAMRLLEPQWYGPADVVDKCLSYMEEHGGEDVTFRQYVIDFCNKHNDSYYVRDKRKYEFIMKYLESKASLSNVKEWVEWKTNSLDTIAMYV